MGSNAPIGGWFAGDIDEVGIWSRAITSTEVTALYNSGDGFAYPFAGVTYTKQFEDIITVTDTLTIQRSLRTHTLQVEDTTTITDVFTKTLIEAVFTQDISDTVTLSDTFTKRIRISKTFSDTITPSDTLTKKGIAQTYTQTFEDIITVTDTLTRGPFPFTKVFSDTFNVTDILERIHIIPPKLPSVNIKLEIESIEYIDPISMVVDRSMGEYNSSSNFEILLPNYNGQYDDTFTLNDDVIIYAEQTIGVPTIKNFRGIIERITYTGKEMKERIRLTGRDYGAVLQDIMVSPRAFKEQEASKIVEALLIQNINGGEITWTDVNSTTTTFDKIIFNNISVFDAIKELSELSGFYFYVDTDKNLHFLEKDTVPSGLTFNNRNITNAVFKTTDDEIFNNVVVYGDRQLTGAQEVFGIQTGSVYTLDDRPSNTLVTGSPYIPTNILQPGGILNINDPLYDDVKWLVDYDARQVVLTSGLIAGDNIGWAGSGIYIDYQRSSPLIAIRQDTTSQTNYGIKDKIIVDRNIKTQEEVNVKADKILLEHKNPKIQGNIKIHEILNVVPGTTATIHVPFHNINYQDYTILNAKYNFTPINNLSNNVLTVTLNKKIGDLTDFAKDVILRLKKIEGTQVDTSITSFEVATGSLSVETSYNTVQRSIGSAFYFHIPNHNQLSSDKSLLGDMRAGSTVVSG